jgi:hypothetical protein
MFFLEYNFKSKLWIFNISLFMILTGAKSISHIALFRQFDFNAHAYKPLYYSLVSLVEQLFSLVAADFLSCLPLLTPDYQEVVSLREKDITSVDKEPSFFDYFLESVRLLFLHERQGSSQE